MLLDFGLVIDLTTEGDQSVGAAAGTPHAVFPLAGDELVDLTGAELRAIAA